MTDFERIILIIVLVVVLVTFTLVIVNFALDRKKAKNNIELQTDLKRMETTISGILNSSLIDMANKVNNQLLSSGDLANRNISELKEKLYLTINDFQERMNNRFNFEFRELKSTIDQRIASINLIVEERFEKGFKDANTTFIDIAKRVEVIDEAQKNIQLLSQEMISLKNILSNNQARGAFGEYQLSQLLQSVFGVNDRLYQMQYTLKEGDDLVRADAVVFMPKPNGMIPIDSKFPYSAYSQLFENKELTKEEEQKIITAFGQDVKKHINDISKKYIVPPLTTDYAFMFVPSDGILTLLHSKLVNIVEYAREKNVTIVSPTTIIPLLSSFKAFIIDSERNKYTSLITEELIKLSKEFNRFSDDWLKLSRAIDSVKKNSDQVNTRVEKIHNRFHDIKNVGLESGIGEDEEIEEIEEV
ncbi:MAG: DNA recombination protein RmuC [Candidatus Izemoplasmatales bacterium]|nr:DNA recombination protein RmuC [Candidatus Izemoplasmatales bacterium]